MKNPRAFTLLETMMAIAVIAITVTAVAELTKSSARLSASSLDRLSATLQAQEGIELARAIRDTNWLKNQAWDTGFDDLQAIEIERIGEEQIKIISRAKYGVSEQEIIFEEILTDWKKGAL